MQQKIPHYHPSSLLIGWMIRNWHLKHQWASHWDNRNYIGLMLDMISADFPIFQNFVPLEDNPGHFQLNFRKANQLENHQTAVPLGTWLKSKSFICENHHLHSVCVLLTFIKWHRIFYLAIQLENLPLPMITSWLIFDTDSMMVRNFWTFIFALENTFHSIWHAFLLYIWRFY